MGKHLPHGAHIAIGEHGVRRICIREIKLIISLRLPADTNVRLECKRAPTVRFNPTHKA
jgi:hypothetical protein